MIYYKSLFIYLEESHMPPDSISAASFIGNLYMIYMVVREIFELSLRWKGMSLKTND